MAGNVVVVGGGVAGMEVAGQLARSGCMVTLIEKESFTGGHVREWHHLFPDRRNSREVTDYLDRQIDHDNITLMAGTTIARMEYGKKVFTVDTDNGTSLSADAVVVATGFDLFRSERKEEYGYGIYDNVITSADLEAMFRNGAIKRTDGTTPEKIGIVHCVGSRDEKAGNIYCSKLCCITAVKQAMELKEHISDAKVYCFYMDMRMGGALYEETYRESQEKYGINFIRGKVSEVGETIDHKLIVKVEDTLVGRPLRMELDMIVLMAGMEMSKGGVKMAQIFGLKTGENRFFAAADHHYGSNASNVEALFLAGSCTAPMNITETISHARAAAAEVINYLRKAER
ncbi:MAG: FAD-dependent oxidoreductase [Bacteroidales bacterium]|nr:FAD-dependent oxidoreductase [Bacteroidales bacterium]